MPIENANLWKALKDKAKEKRAAGEPVSWEALEDIMRNLEFEEQANALTTRVSASKAQKSLAKEIFKAQAEHPDSCLEGIDFLAFSFPEREYAAVARLASFGHVGFRERDLTGLLSFLGALFRSQPEDMSAVFAGKHIGSFCKGISLETAIFKSAEAVWESACAIEKK